MRVPDVEEEKLIIKKKRGTKIIMKKYISGIVTGILFAVLIYMLKTYDVAAVGPDGTSVGFSTINTKIHDYTGVNMQWYEITDMIGYAALGICALFGFAGLVQLIKRRSFAKVDKTIYSLAGLYIVVIGLYIFFERFIINYRPIIMPGASAPDDFDGAREIYKKRFPQSRHRHPVRCRDHCNRIRKAHLRCSLVH